MVNLVTTTQVDFDLTEYANIVKETNFHGNLVSILHTENDSFFPFFKLIQREQKVYIV